MQRTDDNLVNFVRGLPLTNMKEALRSLIQYDFQIDDFDTFLFNFIPNVDFTKISPLMLILNMTHIPTYTPNVQRFVNDSRRYLPTLIETPDIFYEKYDKTKLYNDFLNFLYSVRNEKEYIQHLIHETVEHFPETTDFFLNILSTVSQRFNSSKMPNCLTDLQLFHTIFNVQRVRINFFETSNYEEQLARLFSKSFFPNSPDFSEYFGHGNEDEINRNSIIKLDTHLTTYYDTLREILILGLKTSTQDKLIQFISSFRFIVVDIAKKKQAYDLLSELMGGMNKAEIDEEKNHKELNYIISSYFINLESVLMQISFKTRNQWSNIDPFTAYEKNSIATMENNHPLAAFGEFSWLDENKLKLDDIKRIYKDKDEDIESDTRSWLTKYEELKEKTVDNPNSNFFFATHDAINVGSYQLISKLKYLDLHIYHSKSPLVKEYLRMDKFVYRIALLIECRKTKMIEFLFETLRFIIKTSGYDYINKKLSERPPIAYQRLPEYILNNCIEILLNYYYFGALSRERLEELIDFSSILLSNKKYLRNPDTASEIIEFFADISKHPINDEICFLVVKDTIIRQSFLEVIDFYSRAEKTGTRTGYESQTQMRISCLQLIKFWLQHQVCRNYYRQQYNNKINQKFLHHLIRDLGHFIQSCFSNIEEIRQNKELLTLTPMSEEEKILYDKKIEEERKILKQKANEEIRIANEKAERGEGKFLTEEDINIYKYRTPEEEQEHRIQGKRLQRKSDEEILSVIKNERSNLKFNFTFVVEHFNLVNVILSFVPRAFNEEKVSFDLINLVTSVFLKASTDDLTVENPIELKYDHKYFVASCARLISMMTGNKNVMDRSLDPTFKFDENLCSKILGILEKMSQRHGMYLNEYNSFKYFVEARNKMNILVLDPDVEIPDELCDPITYELLTDPVLLPTGTVLNRTTLDRSTETEMKDPLTWDTFNINDIRDAVEIKEKAEKFFKQHAKPVKK